MEWTRRKSVIIYTTFLFVVFILSGLTNMGNNIINYEILCDNGTVERFNKSTLYLCGGHENPLRKNIIDINFSLAIEKLK